MNSCLKQISLLSLWGKNLGAMLKLNFGNSSKPASTTKCKPKSQKPGKKCDKKKKKANASAGGASASAHGKAKVLQSICLFGVLPAIAGLSAFVFTHIEEHERPKFIPYEYMRLRNKRFPWGDGNKSLFHNPILNALPDGYEDEIALRQEEAKEEPKSEKAKKIKKD